MNKNKICFILCANQERYFQECLLYINELLIPEEFEVEVLSIQDAKSMTAGYNEGMQSSDAKYKVYLHQDVFLVNRNFIFDILKIFSDETIGMIGMVGTPKMPESCIMWDDTRVGRIYSSNLFLAGPSVIGEIREEYAQVEAVDGLLMVTQYDIPWREDLFQKWDFYDISQSYEFRKKGYKVVVPNIVIPWCIHDDGVMNLENYYDERRKFIAEYRG